jgi:uncharacterized protein DUF3352
VKKWIVVAVASAVLLGALAFAAYRIYLNPANDNAVELVPPDAFAYGNVFLDPSTHQKQALRDLLQKFPGAGAPDEARDTLESFLDDALADTGIDFTHDIEPWLGRQIAFSVLPPATAEEAPGVIGYVATTDAGKTIDAVERARREQGVNLDSDSYRDVDYKTGPAGTTTGIVRDFLVIATGQESFKRVVDASEGESLATEGEFDRTTSLLPSDRSALFYFSLSGLVRSLEETGALSAGSSSDFPLLRNLKPVAVAAYLRPDGVVIQGAARTGSGDTETGVGAIDQVPRRAWAALGIRDLGGSIQRLLPQLQFGGFIGNFLSAGLALQLKSFTGLDLQDDVLAWMGDSAAYVEGTDEARGGMLVVTKDGKTSATAVRRLGRSLTARDFPVAIDEGDGTHSSVTLIDNSLPGVLELIATPRHVRFLLGPPARANEAAVGTLAKGPTFQAAKAALGDFAVAGYLDVHRLVAFVENQFERDGGALPATYTSRVRPNLDPVSYLVLGTRTLDGVTSVKLMIGVE